jgi:wyosine [tRNA(Phe)-imidazoG37] synthetase (radical SAM superfamily)
MIAFGPVPSRRLGRSLGINNIPPKICTYSCVYCQLGRTLQMHVDRRPFYAPEEIVSAVRDKVARTKEVGETIDYLTFVPDGEPTLDINLGQEIELLKPLNLPIAVISNASLISREDVRQELMATDWVSLKVDAVRRQTWRNVNRPYRSLKPADILEGALEFAAGYGGRLTTETMLVAGVNDRMEDLKQVGDYLADLQPWVAYLSIPTRPPAEIWAHAPNETSLNRAYQLISERVGRVEYLIGYEGNAFACTGDVEQDLLSITAVHPMREDAVADYLARAGAEWKVVHQLLIEGSVVEAKHDGHTFYLRKITVPRKNDAHE